MVDLVKWCLYVSYFYGRYTGVINFEIDLKTGRTRITKWATIYAATTETMQLTMGLILSRKYLTITMALGVWSIITLTAIINVIITQYYIAIANIRGRYILLNKELEAILTEAKSLIPNRRGVFMTKCCCLADRLDKIAETQSELQNLIDRLSNTYELQLLCMAVTYYLNAVGSFYLMFSVGKYKNLIEDWPPIVLLLGALYFLFFFFDNWITMYNSFHLLDVHGELVTLMDHRTLLSPALDNRLETTHIKVIYIRKPYYLLGYHHYCSVYRNG
ncbi:putative gustatory receptor 59d [Drosophila subpulchrella]|uniref:putative gustatory receptor 59d n=1 Tax=Drosophila subpulchrella TaxID=1486046 RepID=UPI0018A19EE4|nr:putative gustatory receptor 59d [Drosophila subpulchrella]